MMVQVIGIPPVKSPSLTNFLKMILCFELPQNMGQYQINDGLRTVNYGMVKGFTE